MTGSARGLFRATGNVARDVPVLLDNGTFAKAQAFREKDDFYPTPPEPIRALLSVEGAALGRFRKVWEPAVGDGAMERELRAAGWDVIGSDIVDRGANAEIRDFFAYEVAPASCVVTNPPFQECNREPGWIRHALERLGVEYMALMLPLTWVGAVSRAKLWADWPPARVYVMRWRIDFTGQGAPPMLNAWFVWDREHVGDPLLRMLDKIDVRQSSIFDGDAA